MAGQFGDLILEIFERDLGLRVRIVLHRPNLLAGYTYSTRSERGFLSEYCVKTARYKQRLRIVDPQIRVAYGRCMSLRLRWVSGIFAHKVQ